MHRIHESSVYVCVKSNYVEIPYEIESLGNIVVSISPLKGIEYHELARLLEEALSYEYENIQRTNNNHPSAVEWIYHFTYTKKVS